MILAGDIGGTKTTLALFNPLQNHLAPVHSQSYASQDFSDFFTIIDCFLSEQNDIIPFACFGIAGPVFEQRCRTTNLPWVIDAKKIHRRYNIKKVHLLNDLEATAYGTFVLPKDTTLLLNAEDPGVSASPTGNQAVIAIGTGLGEAILYWDGTQHRPSASEGGHTDFAPRNATEIALLKYLLKKQAHVSYERVLSGPGLHAIYQFMKERGDQSEAPWLAERLSLEDPAAVISEAALSKKSDLCISALDLFVSILGAEAGNLALKCLATGGIYLGGGITPQILPKLQEGAFMNAFVDKGRYAELLSKIPVWILRDPQTALLGAAHYAASILTKNQP